jgi:DNA polymerase I
VHDAFLIRAPLDRLDEGIARMRAAMAKASQSVLDGFEIRTDVHRIDYLNRYMDPRGEVMWKRVVELIGQFKGGRSAA